MIEKAISLIIDYIDTEGDGEKITSKDVKVVWFCKTLQNWKCLLFVPRFEDYYFEITYNGDKKEAYIDEYVKRYNTVIVDGD